MEDAIRSQLLDAHAETIQVVIEVADVIASKRSEPLDRSTIESAMQYGLQESGVADRLVDLIRSAVAATDRELLAEPVPASPYVVMTGRGPLLRVTVDDARIVICVAVFDLADSGDGYVRSGSTPESVLSVVVRDT